MNVQREAIDDLFPPRGFGTLISWNIGIAILVLVTVIGLVLITLKLRERFAILGPLAIFGSLIGMYLSWTLLWACNSHARFDPWKLVCVAGFIGCASGMVLSIVALSMRRFSLSAMSFTTISSVIMIGLATMIVVPALSGAIEAARRADCKDKLRKLAIAMHGWHDQNDHLPDLTFSGGVNPPRSWRIELLPYLNRDDIRKQYDDRRTWDDPVNAAVARTDPHWLQCPSVGTWQNRYDQAGRYYTHYLAVTGPDTAFPGGRGISLEAISKADGTSSSIMLAEASGRNVVWTNPRDADVGDQPIGIDVPGNSVHESPGLLSTYHPAGVNVSMADGSTYTIPRRIDPKLLNALTTVHGNDSAERGFN